MPALVIKSREAAGIKTEIKSANFQLKKITALTAKPFLQKEFLEAAKITAEYFAANLGNLLPHLIPSSILENPKMLSKAPFLEPLSKGAFDSENKKEASVLQAPDEDRITLYKSFVREEFAKKKSVFLCLAQNEDVRQIKEKLERGIETYVCAFHNEMGKKDLNKEWKKANQPHPVLIVATPQWLFLPRKDFDAIIIDKENESGWKTLSRPFIDLRFFAETLSKTKNIRFIIGDSFLRTETLYRYKQGEISEFESVKWRLTDKVKTSIIDLKESSKKEKEFKTLSLELLNLIKENMEKGSNVFIFAARKGLSSVTVCRDCGEIVKCFNCGSPMILYKTKDGRVFKCHQCGERRDAAEVCQNCHSWKLMAFGSGIDRVAEEIRKEIPNVNLFEIHKDITETSAQTSSVIKSFYENKGSVLLGTEMAFPYLYKKVGASAISSFDSLFSIPDFRIKEKIFRLILQIKNIARENFLIQTRNPKDPVVEFAVSGNLVEFYRKEIEDRQTLNYPPFGIFIKVTVRGTKNFVSREAENLKNILENFNPAIFPSVHEKKGEPVAVNAVIKLPRNDWPHSSLISVLKSLPPHFEIKVDPDNLL